MGLSMVYGFAKQSGGHIAIYSEVGNGTTVNLFLPAVIAETTPAKKPKPALVAESGGETILVVEDDPKVLRLTIARLEELDYRVISASDGPTAMDILKRRGDIDLVLSDVVMPGGMNGFDVAEQAVKLRPKLKVLLATGYAAGAEQNYAGTAQSDYKVLRKPYGMKELARTLRELLD